LPILKLHELYVIQRLLLFKH